MKALETGKLYVKDVFSEARFYRIPEYQRPYVWGTEQIHDLLNDTSAAMDEAPDKEYFIGCMIWNSVEERSNDYRYPCQDILDGQQRFISLFLLHAVLRDLSKDKDLEKKVQNRLKQEEDKYDNVPERHRVVFVIRRDKTFLEEWVLPPGKTVKVDDLKQISNDEGESVSVRRMAAALIDMVEWWNQRLTGFSEDEKQKYLSSFFRYLSNKVLALFLATPDNLDDAYNLFTVLNSRGLQLQSADILRAQNLRQVPDESKRKELAGDWESYEDVVRDPLKSFDELLKYIFLAKVRFTSGKTKSLKHTFEYLVERGDVTRGEGFFKLIGRYVEHFDKASSGTIKIDSGQLTNFENVFFIISQTIGSAFLMPLLHYRELFGDEQILEFLIKLDNLVSMSWLLGRRTLEQRMFILIRQMDEIVKEDGSRSQRATRFLESDALKFEFKHQTSNTYLSLEDFKSVLESEIWGAFGGSRLNKTRYLLLKLDFLYGNKHTKLAFNRAISSVEHIMPRKPKEAAKISLEDHSNWVHRLGNLVLLDKKKNSSLSNSNYSKKKKKYQKAFESRPYTNSIFINNDSWDIPKLEQQHDKVCDLLYRYYQKNSLAGLEELRASV